MMAAIPTISLDTNVFMDESRNSQILALELLCQARTSTIHLLSIIQHRICK